MMAPRDTQLLHCQANQSVDKYYYGVIDYKMGLAHKLNNMISADV